MNLCKYIEYTYLKEDECSSFISNHITSMIEDCKNHSVKLLMIRPEHIQFAKSQIRAQSSSNNINIGTVVSFPLGTDSIEEKCRQVKEYALQGVADVDVVINYPKIINSENSENNKMKYLNEEITKLLKEAELHKVVIKFILEIGTLSLDQISVISSLVKNLVFRLGLDPTRVYLKTSTGFGFGGATVDAVEVMSQSGSPLQIKASGGIKTVEQLKQFLHAGASCVGTSNLDLLKSCNCKGKR